MSRINVLGALVLGASLGIGCGAGDRADAEREDARSAEVDINIADTSPLAETGCLTAAGDRFVLTALESGGATTTELYQLVGQEEELRKHVGQSVRVTGDAEPAQVAELRENSTAAPVATSGDPNQGQGQARNQNQGQGQPQVQTQSQTRLETRQMRVASVTPTGDDCSAETNQ